jgi:hypothetical protein
MVLDVSQAVRFGPRLCPKLEAEKATLCEKNGGLLRHTCPFRTGTLVFRESLRTRVLAI